MELAWLGCVCGVEGIWLRRIERKLSYVVHLLAFTVFLLTACTCSVEKEQVKDNSICWLFAHEKWSNVCPSGQPLLHYGQEKVKGPRRNGETLRERWECSLIHACTCLAHGHHEKVKHFTSLLIYPQEMGKDCACFVCECV